MSLDKLDFDAVIIGSGAGGGTAAWALCNAGLKVLILEAGPGYDAALDFKLHLPQWEDGFPHKKTENYPPLTADLQNLDPAYDSLRSWNHIQGRLNPSGKRVSYGYQRVQGVGGSSLHFTGEAHRMNPQSMMMQSRFGVAADWPVSYEELEPFYCRAENLVGVAGPIKDTVRPRSVPYPQSAHAFSTHSQLLQAGFSALDMTLVPNALAVLSSSKDGRPACNYCGGCLKGCPRTDKGTIDVTYIRRALATGRCSVISEAEVKYIESGSGDSIKGVHYRHEGKLKYMRVPLLIVAGGAIETPRLLLASDSAYSANGLANESGQVGRNFMETLLWTSNGLSEESVGSHRGLPVDAICWDYNAPDAIAGVIGGCRFSPSVAESDLLGPRAYATRVVDGWGVQHKQKMRQQLGSVVSVSGMCESLPHSESFIALADEKDDAGMPRAMISSYVDDMAIARISFMAGKCREILKASGVNNIFEEFSSYDIFSSSHVFGTCRMGHDPENSVVNSYCRSHRWNNLYIIDASVFPSSGGGESPGLTIQALALRAAEHIVSSADHG
jgi:choline dehydrogenase-like flavoprotein